jgi:hypothetical protein
MAEAGNLRMSSISVRSRKMRAFHHGGASSSISLHDQANEAVRGITQLFRA